VSTPHWTIWGGVETQVVGWVYALSAPMTIAMDRCLAGCSVRPVLDIKVGFIILCEVEHVPALCCTNWAIFGGQWEQLEVSVEVEFRFCWLDDVGWTHR